MKKIGLISDTHGCFDEKLRNFLAETDEIWHAGDIGTIELSDQIAAFKPLNAVRGNADGGPLRIVWPEFSLFECEEVRVLITHIGGYPGHYDKRAWGHIITDHPDLFIAGHSHILRVQFDKKNNLLYLNPGAAGSYGFHRVRTALRFEIDGKDIRNLEVGEWPR